MRDRYPRTLNEAFGPYTSNVIHEAKPKLHLGDAVVTVASALSFVIAVVLALI